jgi:endonuclease/exonuclease/phosphatase family metal-dependent hydrolase
VAHGLLSAVFVLRLPEKDLTMTSIRRSDAAGTKKTNQAGQALVRLAGTSVVALSLLGCMAELGATSDLEQENIDSTEQALHEEDIEVMSLNIRIDKRSDADSIGRFDTRWNRIMHLIRHHDPHIIGFQEVEEKNWDMVEDDMWDAGYEGAFRQRGGGIVNNGSEGVAIFTLRARFTWDGGAVENNFSAAERQRANSCDTQLIDSKGNRNSIRVKLLDKVTNRKLDVFNTHFPSEVSCEKVGMARLMRDYVHNFGDNVILMGDFNTGISSSGNWSEGFERLTTRQSDNKFEDSYLADTYVATHDMDDGHSFTTTDPPMGMYGTKIDHIMVGRAFDIQSARIDRSLFQNVVTVNPSNPLDIDVTRRLINCNEANSVVGDIAVIPGEQRYRLACRTSTGNVSVYDLNAYSDHWAILSVVRRRDCALSDCAASVP